MQNLVWKIVLILFILALCIWSVYPPEQKIRLGKDLRGGTSLIYLVNIPDDAGDRQAILAQTIEVLKDRVNPTGVLDISMAPLGADRIEIVMPLPNEQVKALRAEYQEALRGLLKMSQIRQSELDEALRFNQAVERFGGGSTERAQSLTELQDAHNKYNDAQQQWEAARQSGVSGEELDALEQTLADAQYEYEKLRDAFRRTSLEEARVVRTLNLPNKRDSKATDAPTQTPREISLANLKAEFPHLAKQIDKTVAAHDAYQAKRTTLDDPEDLMRLLRGAGVLEFHIAVRPGASNVNIQQLRDQLQDVGPDKVDSTIARWYPINELKQWYKDPQGLAALEADPQAYFANQGLVAASHEGKYYLLLYTTKDKSITHDGGTQWTVERTGRTVDNLGRPAVSFTLDSAGGNLMLRLTGPHVDEPMAIVLDGQVYSAPSINQPIGNSGIIQGEFSQSELDYLTRVLAAGALSARLSEQPIAMNTLGPSLGRDNLEKGLEACALSIIITATIMLGYYFLAGVVANIALLANALILFGVMAMIDGTFTLPGLAGVALSIAMAVDANVLIYERIREEIVNNKEDLRTAVRLGYRRAMSAIIDGNLTNLIVCVVLMYTATTEVKGFAMTMMIGVFATLFTALFITRVLYTLYTDVYRAKSLPMLPTVFPGVHRALTPSIDWFSKRYIFFGISAVAMLSSLIFVWTRGNQMLDMEFRGGISMTMVTRPAEPGDPADSVIDGRLVMSRPEVEREVRSIGEAPDIDPKSAVFQLRNASVLTMGQATADFKANRFQIKVSSPPEAEEEATITNQVVDAIVAKFGDRLDVTPSLSFQGRDDANHEPYTYSIQRPALGENIKQPEYRQQVRDYMGGVAVVINNIDPPVTPEAAKERIDRLREQPDFSGARGRESEVVGLQPADPSNPAQGYTSLAVLVYDANLDFTKVNPETWERELAASEWRLVSTAFERRSTLQEISSFSPAMAKTLGANAVVAVVVSLIGMLVYIWVRFGSLRFSLSAIVALVHNVVLCLGALALTHYAAGSGFANAIMLDEYRIDLNVIAALLTIIGYSLNDTIVIMDRIRENRGRRTSLTPDMINLSINQTFSRTVLTGGSTILASIILFVLGGTGIQPFAFTFLIGLLVGTYSSVAIAAPLVIGGPKEPAPSPSAAELIRRPRPAETVVSTAP